jgi:hypothetical protein
MKSKRRHQIKENQRKRRKLTAAYIKGGGQSRYARKCAYLLKNGLWGFEVGLPKPW